MSDFLKQIRLRWRRGGRPVVDDQRHSVVPKSKNTFRPPQVRRIPAVRALSMDLGVILDFCPSEAPSTNGRT